MSMAADPVAFAKRVFRTVFGDQALGMLDYLRFPDRGVAWGGAFNGQPARQALFREIVANLRPHAIVETGTYVGTTTEFMALTGLPVYSIEADRRKYGFARARFWNWRNINLLLDDSRTGLYRLFDGPLRNLRDRCLFFYLDAHWNNDLPVSEEIDIAFHQCPSAVIMIDDFQVPFDTGYGYDDYGSEKALVLAYIASAVTKHELRSFYPATPSQEEGGARRGCIVLAKEAATVPILASIPRLRSVSEAGLVC
jgi:hypothetical protein